MDTLRSVTRKSVIKLADGFWDLRGGGIKFPFMVGIRETC
jgi:hypothetical protein